jgi:hypothetical protein
VPQPCALCGRHPEQVIWDADPLDMNNGTGQTMPVASQRNG